MEFESSYGDVIEGREFDDGAGDQSVRARHQFGVDLVIVDFNPGFIRREQRQAEQNGKDAGKEGTPQRAPCSGHCVLSSRIAAHA